ncbi:MAG TPA: choice-of-anchor P family protein [Bryobacteraceae bacterium]|nr:choice-of-anchor P family protein [Bryobacteraceae bacterium]
MFSRHKRFGLLLFSLIPISAWADAVSFSGQATVVKATVLGQSIVLSDTGALDSSGGSKKASLLEATIPGLLTAKALHATTIGEGDRSRSEASVADLDLTVAGHRFSAAFLMARAMALCSTNGRSTVSGDSFIARLAIDNQSITVTGEPNQTITLIDGVKVVINEQKSDGHGDITVNALHVVAPGVADVIIASAHADVVCRSGQCSISGNDFVTGGGWIVAPSGDRGTFAVAGGLKNGGLWGHLQYHDHGTGLKVKGTGVTLYKYKEDGTYREDGTARHIEGTCEINGVAGTYSVDVADNGEPGRNDYFKITLSNGYAASGNLQGGNIQLHGSCK